MNEYFASTRISMRYITVFLIMYLLLLVSICFTYVPLRSDAERDDNPVRQKSSRYLPICGLDILQGLKGVGEMREAVDSESCVVGTFLIERDNMDHPILLLMYP